MPVDNFSAQTSAFKAWLERKGWVISPSVEIADFRAEGQGRGLRATRQIAEGDVLFSIPQSALLRAESDPELMKVFEGTEFGSWIKLIVRMMVAQESKDWKPYFDVLPTEFNTPMFWSESEIKSLLQGSAMIDKVGRDEADLMYDEISKTILAQPYFASLPETSKSREAFHRMGSLIMSYGFDFPASIEAHREEGDDDDDEDGEDVGKSMIPLADTLNSHTKLHNARLVLPETPAGNLEMIASKEIPAGTQIYNIYGNQPSSDMLRRYGFVELGGTSYEVVEFSLEEVVEAAARTLDDSVLSVEQRFEKLADYMDELPTSFEIGLSAADEADEVAEVDIEPELILAANALTKSQIKRKVFKEIVEATEAEQVWPEARQMLISMLEARRAKYGDVTPEPKVPSSSSSTRVLLSKQDMAAQVRRSEIHVIDLALDWLRADTGDREDDDAPPSTKKLKT